MRSWFVTIAEETGPKHYLLLQEPRILQGKTARAILNARLSFWRNEHMEQPNRGIHIKAQIFDKGVLDSVFHKIEEYYNEKRRNKDGSPLSVIQLALLWFLHMRCLLHIASTALFHAALDLLKGDTTQFKKNHILIQSLRNHFSDILDFVPLYIKKIQFVQRKRSFLEDRYSTLFCSWVLTYPLMILGTDVF